MRIDTSRLITCNGHGHHFLGILTDDQGNRELRVTARPLAALSVPSRDYWQLSRRHSIREPRGEDEVRRASSEGGPLLIGSPYREYVWPSLAQIRQMAATGTEWQPGDLNLNTNARGERHRIPLPARVKCWCGSMVVIR